MNILTLPRDPPSTISRVPYLSSERYDGGPFLTYPQRKGREYDIYGRLTAPAGELGLFLQPWFYFGLLFEFTEGIEQQDNDNVLQWIYDNFLTKDGDETYLDSLLIVPPVLNLWHRKLQYQEINACKRRCNHLLECLVLTFRTLALPSQDLDHRIRYSIAALAECLTTFIRYFSKTRNNVLKSSIPWESEFLTAEVEKETLAVGWCPSDIESVKLKYNSLQILYILSKMNRLNSAHGHTSCNRHRASCIKSMTITRSLMFKRDVALCFSSTWVLS
jgi:hypothetical protein